MIKQPLEPYGTAAEDLLYWAKQYLIGKVYTLGIKNGFENSFDRKHYAAAVDAVKTTEQLRKTMNEVARNGLTSSNVYASPVTSFCTYVSADRKIESIKEINTGYRDAYLTQNPRRLKPSTLEGEMVQINSLFKYIEQNNIDSEAGKPHLFSLGRTRSGRKTVSPVIKEEKEIVYLNSDELKLFLEILDTFPFKVQNSARPKLMVKLVTFGGLRGEELIGLKKSSVDFVNNPSSLLSGRFMRLLIFGKGSKERIVYIKASLVEKEYKHHIGDAEKCQGDLLFCNDKGKMFSLRTLYDLIRRLMEHSKIDKGGRFGLHILRRSYASFMFLKGVDFSVVSELLGHGDTEVTELYVHVSREGLREVAKLWEDI